MKEIKINEVYAIPFKKLGFATEVLEYDDGKEVFYGPAICMVNDYPIAEMFEGYEGASKMEEIKGNYLLIEYIGSGYFKELSTGIIINCYNDEVQFEDNGSLNALCGCKDDCTDIEEVYYHYLSLEKSPVILDSRHILELNDTIKKEYAQTTLPQQDKISKQLLEFDKASRYCCKKAFDEISAELQEIAETENFIFNHCSKKPQYHK